MENLKDKAINPIVTQVDVYDDGTRRNCFQTEGMTYREYLIAQIAAGYAANKWAAGHWDVADIIDRSFAVAGQIIKRLEEEKQPKPEEPKNK